MSTRGLVEGEMCTQKCEQEIFGSCRFNRVREMFVGEKNGGSLQVCRRYLHWGQKKYKPDTMREHLDEEPKKGLDASER